MARAGLRVLLLDRVHPARDTLSTHALMRAGVLQLDRWGLLDRIVAAGTPAVTGTTFHYADARRARRAHRAAVRAAADRARPDPASRPRSEAGVEARIGVDVSGVTGADNGRVTGAALRRRGAAPEQVVRAAAHRRRRRAALRHRPRGRGPHDLAGRRGERVRLRVLARPTARPTTTGTTARASPRASSRPTTAWPASGPGCPPRSSRRAAARASTRVFADVLAQAAPGVELPGGRSGSGRCAGSPACPPGCAGPSATGGRWSATRARSRTR